MSEALRSGDPWAREPGPDRVHQFRPRPPADSVGDDIDDAYRVADEHLQEGRRRAGWRNQRPYDWRSPGYVPGGGYGYGGRIAEGLLEQLIRSYMDMMSVIGTVMSGTARSPYPPRPYPHPDDQYYSRRFAQGARSGGARIEVTSNQPIRVTLDLGRCPPNAALVVQPLRIFNAVAPELTNVRLELLESHYVLHLEVPDEQPPGVYSAAITDSRTGEPYGTLAIRVGRPGPSRTSRPRKTNPPG